MQITKGSRVKDWIVLSDELNRISPTTGWNELYYDCRCTCCEQVFEVTRSNLLKENSCFRCWNCRFKYTPSRKTHGEASNRTRLYTIWANMWDRCRRPENKNYHTYGGKGITVCQAWEDYIVFKSWAIANSYAKDLTIHRIDSNKGYSPDNCAWITPQENASARARKIKCNNGKLYASAEDAARDLDCTAQAVRLAARKHITIRGYDVAYE